jgi:superfamily II DNA helicase RecQ
MSACGMRCGCCTKSDLGASAARGASSEGIAEPAVILHGRESPDTELLNRLKALRRELASALGVPPYAVFSDAILYEIAFRRPASKDELLTISGIGRTTLARHGRQLLRLLKRNCRER